MSGRSSAGCRTPKQLGKMFPNRVGKGCPFTPWARGCRSWCIAWCKSGASSCAKTVSKEFEIGSGPSGGGADASSWVWRFMTLVIQRGVPDRRGQVPALRAEHGLSANTEVLWGPGQLIQACGHLTSHPGSPGPMDHEGKTGAQSPSQCEESKRRAEERAEARGKEGTKPTNMKTPEQNGHGCSQTGLSCSSGSSQPVGTMSWENCCAEGNLCNLEQTGLLPGPLKMGQKGSWVLLFSAEEGAW